MRGSPKEIRTLQGAHERGRRAENEFRATLSDNARESTQLEDMFEHWDLMDDGVTYDIKNIKTVDAHGKSVHHWIEFRNVKGKSGSIEGKADMMVFEDRDDWIIIDRIKLKKFCEDKAVGILGEGKKPYYWYSRGLDKTMLVPTSDLRVIANELRSKVKLKD
jgi:hypothetical protein